MRARLLLIVDDHSRLLVDGRFYGRENARACQQLRSPPVIMTVRQLRALALLAAHVLMAVPSNMYPNGFGPFA